MLLAAHSVLAQKNFSTRDFDESNGLSSNFTEAITQAASGHLIIASKGGIDRFDGKNFQNIHAVGDSVGLDYVTSMHRSEDEIWFGRFDGTIGRFNNELEVYETGITGQIKHIFKDAKDGIWAFSRSGYVFWTDGADTCRYDMSERDMLINAVIPYKLKEFIIGSNDGLWLVRFESGNDFQVLHHIDGLPETKITALKYEPGKDVLWVGTEDAGLHRVFSPFTTEQRVVEFKLHDEEHIDDVQTIFTDHAGRIWLGTFGKGLMRIEYYGKDEDDFIETRFEELIDQDHLIRDIFEDNENNIWIATFGGGIVQIYEKVFHQPFDDNWLRKQSITQLFRDSKGNVWLGIDKGIFRTSEYAKNGNSYQYFHVGGNQVSAIAEDKYGKIWVGTKSSGIYTLQVGSENFEKVAYNEGNLADAINSIMPTENAMYISSKAGLLEFSFAEQLQKHYSTLDGLPHNNVKFSFEDSDNRLWIACQGNRVAYLWKNTIKFVESGDSQLIVDVQYILEDGSKRLWFATMGNGISVLDGSVVRNINQQNGLPSNYCYQMVLDNDGYVWVSHQKSLTQISPDLKVNRIINREELAPTENSMISFLFKDSEGNIWISSTHNVVKFNPAIDKMIKAVPQLSISRMFIDGEPVEMSKGLQLPFRNKKYEFEFELAGISLRNPDNIRYKYQLKGSSESWKGYGSNEKLQLPGLGYGNYTLNVIASKNDGPWTPEPVSYSFSIARPFWLSWIFWVIFAFIISFAVIMFVRYRTYRLMKDKADLEKVVQERTIEIQEQKSEIERSRDEIAKYAKDITDSIKYAKRIQKAIFPAWRDVQDILPESFVFFQSKDLVSGDFYFAENVGSKTIFCAVDCTGHGVPGGFMSIVANNLLQQAIKQVGLTKPSDILEYLNRGVTHTLHQTYEESSVKDGMDIALCCWDRKTNQLEYAGAYNPIYIFRNEELIEVKGDRFPVGAFVGEEIRQFTNHRIQLQKNDMIYVFSDGYYDQFGGPNGKKFMIRRFKAMLTEIHKEPVDRQYDLVAKNLRNWKGNLEQVDDIVVMGVRVT
ncbi:MAG: SpoIIE family protein phosphatase [Flavobacteriales bacterium]|nr:SpoIIE family protein phosphatase [Flavobacteriales bacterium]